VPVSARARSIYTSPPRKCCSSSSSCGPRSTWGGPFSPTWPYAPRRSCRTHWPAPLLLEMERSPILHALFTGDTEVLGTVVDTAADDRTSLLRERTKSMESYFLLLGEEGLVRPDLS